MEPRQTTPTHGQMYLQCTDHSCTVKTSLLPTLATPPSLATLSNVIYQDRDGPSGDYYLVGPSSPEGSTVGP